MLQWEEVGLPRLVVECLSQSTTHNDLVTKPDLYRDPEVEEYWVCRAHPMHAHTVYQRDGRGRWQERPVPDEQGLYSPVLGTRLRFHEEDGFQCSPRARGRLSMLAMDPQPLSYLRINCHTHRNITNRFRVSLISSITVSISP